jgi:16S rRNA processing protein RimM
MDQLLVVGKISNAHGIKGEVKVIPFLDEIGQFLSFKSVYIKQNKDSLKKLKVQHVRIHKKSVLLMLQDISTRNDAEALINAEILIDREQDRLAEDEFYIADIIGMRVLDASGQYIGVIKDVLTTTGSVDTLEIQTAENSKLIYVPFRKCYFNNINPEKGTLMGNIPTDFFEL